MSIGPVSTRPREISVVEPVSPALERVKRILFQPFDLGKWFVIGFCAWLAQLGESGTGGSFNSNSGSHHNYQGEDFHRDLVRAKDYVLEHLNWIVPLVVGLVVIGLALWLVFLWLNSRGKFMFLHCVALDKAEVVEPWNKFADEANSLFLFRLVLGLVTMVCTLPLLIIALVIVFKMFHRRPVCFQRHPQCDRVRVFVFRPGHRVCHHPKADLGFRGAHHVPAP